MSDYGEEAKKIDGSNRLDVYMFVVIALGLILRIIALGAKSMYWDEAFGPYAAKFDILSLVTNSGGFFKFGMLDSSSPPLYYVLFHYWVLSGESVFWTRFFSVIFGVLCIPLTYWIGAEIFDRKVGLVAALILAVAPFQINYSQYVRNYSMITFLVLLSALSFLKLLREDKLRWWFSYVLLSTAAVYTHHFAWFWLLVPNVYYILRWSQYKNLKRKWIISQAAIFLLYAPWLPLFLKEISVEGGSHGPGARSLLLSFPATFYVFAVGKVLPKISTVVIILPACLLFASLLGFWLWSAKGEIQRSLFLFLWMLLPLTMAILISFKLHIYDVSAARYLIFLAPAFYIAIAKGITAVQRREIVVILTLALIAAMVPPLIYHYRRDDFRDIKTGAHYIAERKRAGDAILHFSSLWMSFLYYHKNPPNEFNWYIPEDFEKFVKLVKEHQVKRIWVVSSDTTTSAEMVSGFLEEEQGDSSSDGVSFSDEITRVTGMPLQLVDERIYPGRLTIRIHLYEILDGEKAHKKVDAERKIHSERRGGFKRGFCS